MEKMNKILKLAIIQLVVILFLITTTKVFAEQPTLLPNSVFVFEKPDDGLTRPILFFYPGNSLVINGDSVISSNALAYD
jgi:hypothetical protein